MFRRSLFANHVRNLFEHNFLGDSELADDYIFHSILALVVYEYLITINQEISLVWRRKWSLSVWVFIANRYLLLLNTLSEAMPIGSFHSGCRAAVVITIASYAAQFLVFGVFSALRVYALWYPNTLLAYIVLGLNLVPIVTNIISYSYATITYTDSICSQSSTLSAGANLRCQYKPDELLACHQKY
ncbi:hypothetical protein EW026_g4045 [Hermanssonia centrifuga]|uniref:DUF6533 domain-containing protein n=1 Tax=Hermanssonia centrifuga TaxID=98765 RepID=A0A4S4KIF3_9APHY|nr:hypothetical protein EW026_g4045 [Hermanssonia centrifuga]